ncbi:glycosyl hydrolase family 61-domain-containing protein [Armillaria borealis]|uniref:AA9 family lytic polysaccharide monooxygenase n=1 Tax=Armillaria borealis TaxID=47425 RepID=A0AA39JSP9_9AGAR|nr:glycosyl hydrolase family 61-domain-containing protein [Armillaria borealis]
MTSCILTKIYKKYMLTASLQVTWKLALLLWSDGPEYISTQFLRDIICNGVINPYHAPISTTIITVPAGSTVTAEWHHTLDGANSADSSDPIDSSHKGAVMSYLAKVDNATQTDYMAVDTLIANDGKVSSTIPDCIELGQYLLHHEQLIGQSFALTRMKCVQLEITGGGSTSPSTVSFPGAYAGSDLGIAINLYQTLTGVTIPSQCSALYGSLSP